MEPQHLSCDMISTLSPCIIETILCLVPIKEAARTSIRSKEWRYKWTKIPKLDFDDCMFEESTDDENQVSDSEQTMASERKMMGKRSKLFNVIYQVLLMRQGPIHEFILSTNVDKTCVEIDHIISYLLRNNALKKLTLQLNEEEGGWYYWLPLSVFSLYHLTDLHLCACDLNIEPTFSGFARLTKLYMKDVYISMKTFLHLLSNSPKLKDFTLITDEEYLFGDANSTVFELFKCLPAIEDLSTYSWITRCFVINSVPQDIPALLIHLKYFHLEFMSFGHDDEVRFLAILIKSSPNLEKITLDISSGYVGDKNASIIRESCSNIWLEHLNELKMVSFTNSKTEVEFVKLILAKSPKLKKVDLFCEFDEDEEVDKSEMLRNLFGTPPPISTVAEFIFRGFGIRC